MKGSLVKKHGKYYVRAELGIDPATGKRKQKWINTDTEKKKEAEKLLPSILVDVQKSRDAASMQPIDLVSPALPVSEYMVKWLAHIKGIVRHSTYLTYEWATNEYITPQLGRISVKLLSPLNVQEFINYLKTVKCKPKSDKSKAPLKPLSATSIRYNYNVLKSALTQAVKWQVITSNPCEAIDPPKKVKFDYKVYDTLQMKKLLQGIKNTSIALPILMACTTGMRRGELCGLQWKDVDLDKLSIHVCQSLDYVEGELQNGPVKSRERTLSIDTALVTALKKEKIIQASDKLQAGELYQKKGFVWAWPNGEPHSPDYLYKNFKKIAAKCELPIIRLHDLRHSYATFLRDNGVTMETISELLGHASSSFTHATYAHPSTETQKPAVAAISTLTADIL